MAKILIVEDDIELAQLIARWVSKDGHDTQLVAESAEGLSRAKHYHFDLVILDWYLPDGSGLEVLKQIRRLKLKTAVLMLTGKVSVQDRVDGLESGADDYLCKPFDARELMARIRTLLRRRGEYSSDIVTRRLLSLDTRKRRFYYNEQEVLLQPREYSLLEFLMQNCGSYFTVETLLNRVWPADEAPSREAVTSCIKRIRKKFDELGEPSLIQNVHGYGYGISELPE